jgi:murein DD-endopeptidase MepM/ murein hydrolase activator NlpD
MRFASSKTVVPAILLAVFLLTIGRGMAVRGESAIEELKRDIAAKEAEIKRLEAEEAAYRQSLNQASLQARTLQGEIGRLDAAIRQIGYRLAITRAELDATLLRLKAISSDILATEANIGRRKTQVASALREIAYIDETGFLAILLGAPTISDFFDNAAQMANLEEAMRQDLAAMRQLKEKLETDRAREEELEATQRAKQQELSAQQAISELKKKDRADLLQKTRNQEARYQQLLAENQKRQQEILREIEALESDLRKLLLRVTVPARQPGLFAWPVDGGYVTQEYGDTKSTGFINDAYTFHNGIDIGHQDGIGTPIRAVMDGTVVASGNLSPYAYGRWVAVDHGNGLISLYAHLSRIAVSNGKQVRRGSVVGYMGSTGYVTGPHLHLTVYAAETFKVVERSYGLLPLGASINPRDYLPR